jgi:hypothetical protein
MPYAPTKKCKQQEHSTIQMNIVIAVPEHVDLMPSEDGQLTETCKGNKYLQIQSHGTVLTIIIL